jgi:hypothetical protein
MHLVGLLFMANSPANEKDIPYALLGMTGHGPSGRRQFLSLDIHHSTCKLQVSR